MIGVLSNKTDLNRMPKPHKTADLSLHLPRKHSDRHTDRQRDIQTDGLCDHGDNSRHPSHIYHVYGEFVLVKPIYKILHRL